MKVRTQRLTLKIEQGFTLIEVLIAAVILFSALSLTAELFKVSSFSSTKASNTTTFYQVHPAALASIKLEVKISAHKNLGEDLNGTLRILGIDYVWQANLLSLLPPAPDLNRVEEENARFGLYQVEVNASKETKKQHFVFLVATW